MPNLNRRQLFEKAASAFLVARLCKCNPAQASEARGAADAIAKGVAFLASLVDAELDLLPEYRGANVYWLYHDNYLAAKVLTPTHPEVAKRIRRAIRSHGITQSGKIEILYREAKQPLPFRRYKLVEVKQIGDKILKTEIIESERLDGWQAYADLLLLAAIALADAEPAKARNHFDTALAMWDGHGLNDQATKASGKPKYATYKLALALIAAARLKTTPSIQNELVQKLLAQQADEGGWITDYDANGRRLGLANVETTSLAILGLTEAATADKQ